MKKIKVAKALVQQPIERKQEKGEALNPLKFHPSKKPQAVKTSRGTFGIK